MPWPQSRLPVAHRGTAAVAALARARPRPRPRRPRQDRDSASARRLLVTEPPVGQCATVRNPVSARAGRA